MSLKVDLQTAVQKRKKKTNSLLLHARGNNRLGIGRLNNKLIQHHIIH